MSIFSGLFGSSKPQVTQPPPVPKIGDANAEAAAREERYRARSKYGVEDTNLTSGGTGGLGKQGQGQRSRAMLG